MIRRRVRVAPALFEQIDAVLRPERGPHGEPSAADFVTWELPHIVEKFAVGFDELPEVDGLSGNRVLIAPSAVVHAIAVYGILITDDTIELFWISIDP